MLADVGEQLVHRLIDHLRVRALGLGMPRGGDPIRDDPLELLGRHARVRRHHDLADGFVAAGQRALEVTLEQRGERLLLLPLGVLRRQHLHAVEGERELDIQRLLRPERTVVVERGDPLRLGNEVAASLRRHLLDELHDGFLRGTVVPGGQRIRGQGGSARERSRCELSPDCTSASYLATNAPRIDALIFGQWPNQ